MERLLPPLSEALAMRLGVVSLERGLDFRRDFGGLTPANASDPTRPKRKGNQMGKDGRDNRLGEAGMGERGDYACGG